MAEQTSPIALLLIAALAAAPGCRAIVDDSSVRPQPIEPAQSSVDTAAVPDNAVPDNAVPDNAVPVRAAPAAPEENDARWHERLRVIASRYGEWGRVDDEFPWAPGLCRMPRPGQARLSAAEEGTPHGRKLYTLYAKDPAAYGAPASVMGTPAIPELAGCEQVIVKEAWRPEPLERGAALDDLRALRPAHHDGVDYGPGARAGLYVMFKLPEETQGTDRGWVYGTIAPDMQTITAAGRVESCMGCHEVAPHGRLFGIEGWGAKPRADDRRGASNHG